jgi:hypothetical protein
MNQSVALEHLNSDRKNIIVRNRSAEQVQRYPLRARTFRRFTAVWYSPDRDHQRNSSE